MSFPDEEAKLQAGRISNLEREEILIELGNIAQEKYDEFIVQGGLSKGYNLFKLKGSLKFKTDVESFENVYYLEGQDSNWTDIANYFEYGTGIYNTTRAGKWRGGYIKPIYADYMRFVNKFGKFVSTKRVKGVHPIFAMQKAIKYVDFNRKRLQRNIRISFIGEE
jgi:hypothetical protein